MLVPFLLLLSAFDYSTQNPGKQLSKDAECDCDWRYLKHYEAKGCFPVYEEKSDVGKSECKCPKRFDCSQPDEEVNSDENACVYRKRVYPVGSEIPTGSACESCSCRRPTQEPASMICPHADCFDDLRFTKEGCYYVNKENECCPTIECPAKGEENKVPTCEYKGNIYYEGQQIYPDEDPCLICSCNSNWTGINGTTCGQIGCERELERHARELKQGCIPIYHEKTCCPIEYHCPANFEFNVNGGPSYKSEDDEDEMCHFEGRYYPIGHVLDIKHPTNCVKCTCKTPPDFTCIKSSCPGPPNGDYNNCRAFYKPNTCCPDYKCGGKNAPVCKYKGKIYYGGEEIYPDEDTCLTCLRNSNWTGINSSTCRQYDCTLERDVRKLKQGCVPIYHEKTCCPIEYHCPGDDFEFNVNKGSSYKAEDDEDYSTQNPGQQLSKDTECDCDWSYLKHYEVKGCFPVYEEKTDVGKSECKCPKRFDCSQADEVNSDENVCVYKKHVYPVGSVIPTTDPCAWHCYCLGDNFTQTTTITCGHVDCFSVLPDGCRYVYKENECCPDTECPNKENGNSSKVPLCEYKGKMYYEGEKFYPDDDCLTCLCNSNWTGINGSTCRSACTALERHEKELKQGCIPIYYEKRCCPIGYHCPAEDFDFKVDRGVSYNSEYDEDEMCHFGDRIYPIGHVLDYKHPTNCVTCTCKTPPDFTCIHRSCPRPPNFDYSKCRYFYKPNTCCPDYQCPEKNGEFCDPFDCLKIKRTYCDASMLPTDFPETPEELRTICSNVNIFGTCMIQVYESCEYNKDFVDIMRKGLDFVNTVCDEDHPIFNVISSNLGCITPIARKVENECNQSRFVEENYDAILAHEMRLSDNFDRMDVLSCLTPFWEVNCRSIVMGLHCGSEVKEAVKVLLSGTHHSYNERCTRKILEELQPLSEAYETAIEAEQRLKNAINKRK